MFDFMQPQPAGGRGLGLGREAGWALRVRQLSDISGTVHWPAVLEEIVPYAFCGAA